MVILRPNFEATPFLDKETEEFSNFFIRPFLALSYIYSFIYSGLPRKIYLLANQSITEFYI